MRWQQLPELVRKARPQLRIAGLAAAGWSVFACAYVIVGRISYPYELEWMAGAILDHVERVQKGLPVYAEPSASWIPFLYTPLYYWVAAAVARFLPLVAACRTVSIASSVVQAVCVWRLARRRGASAYWSAIGVGAFFAAFSIVDFWYDLERPDALFVAMLMCGAVVLEEAPGLGGAIAAGAILGLAFFAKQPATLFILAAIAALLLRREIKRAAALAAVAGCIFVLLAHHLNATTDGWFSYYCLKMPVAHGMSWSLIPQFFFIDMPHAWAWSIATAALVGTFVMRRFKPDEDAIFIAFLGAGFLAAMTSRLHIGGWSNVLSFWTPFGAAAIAVYGARLESSLVEQGSLTAQASAALLPLVAAAQLLSCAFAPGDKIPARNSAPRFNALVGEVRDLEKKGEVLTVGRGHLTTQRHFHIAALIDVVTVEHKLPTDLVSALRKQRFAAVVIDNLDDLWMPLHPELDGDFFFLVASGYYVAMRIDERVPIPVQGWPARPRWVLLPREQRLDEGARTVLVRKTLAELNLAQIGHPFDDDHVNDLALAVRHVGEEAEHERNAD